LANINKRKISPNFLIGVLLALATLSIYSQTWQYDSVCYDDPLFLDNPNVRQGLSFESIQWAFTDATAVSNYWIPLTWLSFILDFQLFGGNPGGFHFTNTIFHLLNVILLFVFCLRIFKSTLPSVIVASLFAVHPIHVESVAWITCRKDLLCGFFWISALIAYVMYVEKKGLFPYCAVFLLFFMGLMSKPMIMTFPFVLLLLDLWPLRRVNRAQSNNQLQRDILKLIIEKIPFFLVVFFFSILTYLTQKSGNVLTTSTEHYTLTLRFLNSFVAYAFYLEKLICPVNLSLLYPYPEKLYLLNHTLSFVVIVSITTLFFIKKKRYPFLLTGWFWFLGTLVPVIGIYIVGIFLYTDRYAYMPLIGLYMILACGFDYFIRKRPEIKKTALSLLVITISLFGFISFMQVTYWQNSVTLFERAISINPESSVAYNNLGYGYMRMGKFDKAALHLKRAISLAPEYFSPYYNLAGTYYLTRQYDKAIECYRKTVQLKPDYSMAYLNMGIVFMDVGDTKEAIEAFLKCIEIDPNSKRAQYFLRRTLYKDKDG